MKQVSSSIVHPTRFGSRRKAGNWFHTLAFRVCPGLTLIVALITAQPKLIVNRVHLSANRAALISMLEVARPLRGRLTGFGYFPLEFKTQQVLDGIVYGYKGPPKTKIANKRGIARIAQQIEEDYKQSPTAQRTADKASLILLEANSGRLHDALSLLEEAAFRDPQDATILSDLAAGYLAWTRPDPPGAFIALEMASRAVHRDPTLPEAQFNLALALEKCALFHQARRAWIRYLHLDPQSGWAAEAREHLTELHRPSPRQLWGKVWNKKIRSGSVIDIPTKLYPIAQEDTMEEILGRWADFSSKGLTEEASQELGTARRIGNIILHYDKTLHDAVKVIDMAKTDTNVVYLREGHKAYRLGMQYFHTERIEHAQALLELAANYFTLAGSPCQYWANLALAQIASRNRALHLSETLTDKIRATANLSIYNSLNTSLILEEGISQIRGNNYALAQTILTPLALYHSQEELDGEANLYLAETEEALGQSYWFHRNVALRALSDIPASPFLFQLFTDIAEDFSTTYPEAATRLLNEALEGARELSNKSLAANTLLVKFSTDYLTKNTAAARQDLADLDRTMKGIIDPLLRRRLAIEKEIALCRTSYSPPVNPCIEALTTSIEDHNKYDQKHSTEYYALRAELFNLSHKSASEEAELTRGVDAYEELTLPSSPNRHKDLDGLFDRLTYLALSRNDNVKAFEYSERYHGTFILLPNKSGYTYPFRMALGMATTSRRLYSSKEFTGHLPRLTVLVDYNVSGNAISAWVFRNGSAKFINLGTIGRQYIEGSAKSYANHSVTTPRLSSLKLYDKLIQPIRFLFPNEGDLIILAPPSLKGVDFFHLQKTGASSTLDRDYNISTIYKAASFSSHGQLPTALAGC